MQCPFVSILSNTPIRETITVFDLSAATHLTTSISTGTLLSSACDFMLCLAVLMNDDIANPVVRGAEHVDAVTTLY